MSDIVKRLREFEHNWVDKLDMADACQDAADEIERKDAAIAELQSDLVSVEKVSEYRLEAIAELVGALKDARIYIAEVCVASVVNELDAVIAKYETTTKETK